MEGHIKGYLECRNKSILWLGTESYQDHLNNKVVAIIDAMTSG